MSRINWIILSLALMLPGAAGLGWGHLQKQAVADRIREAAEAVADAPSADEYVAMYDQWSQLSAAQKAANPWGQGIYGGSEIQKRLRQDQYMRLEADLPELAAGVKSYPMQLADVLYGTGWAEYLAAYQRQRETRGLVMTASTIFLFSGGLLCIGGLVKYFIVRFLRKEPEVQQEDAPILQPSKKSPPKTEDINAKAASYSPAECDGELPVIGEEAEPRSVHAPGYFESVMSRQRRPESGKKPHIAPVGETTAVKGVSVLEPASVGDGDSYFGWAVDPRNEDAALATMMTTQPVTNGLSELTEEVSAIRQFAAAQQDQMRKLQDGYDWMIIRRFCMRVIRCIDNLDDRLTKLGPEDPLLQECLSDIRDELVFSLESSGVEQYQPDLKIPFKGLEKYAEAVRQRIPATDASLAGTIAEIVRPGYQYLISDVDVKIVRCAQVKLYDTAETEA